MKKLLLLCPFLYACAGPMSPFGAHPISPKLLNPESGLSNGNFRERSLAGEILIDHLSSASIRFRPERQLLHDRSNFEIEIEDPHGIGHEAEIRLFYQGQDITPILESSATKSVKANKLIYRFENFRLILNRENEIFVSYRRDIGSKLVLQQYKRPECSWRRQSQILDPGVFENKYTLFNTVENLSYKNGVNPSFVAGLIAQESSFNPKAVSSARAIGLTQITSLAQVPIVERHPSWPRFERIDEYPPFVIKSLVMMGQINSSNEWRLNPNLSVQGGIEHMQLVEKYWSRPINKKLMEKTLGEGENVFSDVLLASYNSGAYRVKRNLKRKGKNWLLSSELGEAKKYILKVKSYCYHFSKSDSIKL